MMLDKRGGYIALISAIVIAAVLLIITSTLSFSGFFSRFNTLSNEFKDRSAALAEACADAALLDMADGTAITAPTQVPMGSDFCTIYSIQSDTPAPGQTTILTQASVQNIFTNLKVVADNTDESIVSWEEIPHIP